MPRYKRNIVATLVGSRRVSSARRYAGDIAAGLGNIAMRGSALEAAS